MSAASRPTIDRLLTIVEQLPGFALYLATLAAHLPAAIARELIAVVVLWILSLITGWSIPIDTLATIVGFAPLALSAAALLLWPIVSPIDGRLWQTLSGGRPPEADERHAFQAAIAELRQADPAVRPPRHWFVAEDSSNNGAAYSRSILINRGTLESPRAAAMIAHELGHLHSTDSLLTSATNLLLLKAMQPPNPSPIWLLPLRALLWIASGQASASLTHRLWEIYWRTREFAADQYAARLGQGQALAQSLTQDALPYEQPIKTMRFSTATHPYTKPRIARLAHQPPPARQQAPTPAAQRAPAPAPAPLSQPEEEL